MTPVNFIQFEGTANSSLIGKLIEENRRDDGKISNEETIESIGGAIFLAGADTVMLDHTTSSS